MAGSDSFVQVPPDSTGKLVDCDSLTTGSGTVQRERHRVAGAAAAELADVRNAIPGVSDYGLATRRVPRSFKFFNVNANVNGDNTIVAAVVGKRIKVVWFLVQIQGGAGANVSWKDSAATVVIGPISIDLNGSWSLGPIQDPAFVMATSAGNALVLNNNVAQATQVTGLYWDDDAS